MDSIKNGLTQIIYHISYSKTPQQQQAPPSFHQTQRIWILKSLNTLDSTTFANHSGYGISQMWLAATSFLVSSRMTRHFSLLNFILIWTMGLTFSSMVSQWQKKFGSILAMSADDHAKAIMFIEITLAILSSNPLPNVVSSLNFFPFISFS